jgi:crotonobetaine/carnitine-CoA ligase
VIEIDEQTTIGSAFDRATQAFGAASLLAVPANEARSYLRQGAEISYAAAAATAAQLAERYRSAGYGLGHRVALLLESRPEHMLHKLALNTIGACCVPINPDYRAAETAYLIDHARVDLVVALDARREQLEAAVAAAAHKPALCWAEDPDHLPRATTAAAAGAPSGDTPASILYTSGTTGRPKGCVLSHRYELAAGAWYAKLGGLVSVRERAERLYNPLPLFHVNASILSFYCMLLTGGCQVQTDRFQPSRWWTEVSTSGATIVHYLGVVVSMLLGRPPEPADRQHHVRLGFGAGVEPQLHAAFEQRFGFPLVELWGMTETVRVLADHEEPRRVGTRAFGRAQPGHEVLVADDDNQPVPDGTPGEMLVRHSTATPRKDFFSGYLDDPVATEAAWRGGWFHTGDVVTRDADGMLHFVDRRKNIIRRSGENIAAAEVEALLLTHPLVEQAAVMALPDEVREEEVLACVVLREPTADAALRAAHARTLFDFCLGNLAYFKAPGWMWMADGIPTTGTQKIQKHRIFPAGIDPRTLPDMLDLRSLKRRA